MKEKAKIVQISGEEGFDEDSAVTYTTLLIYPQNSKAFKLFHINDRTPSDHLLFRNLNFLLTLGEDFFRLFEKYNITDDISFIDYDKYDCKYAYEPFLKDYSFNDLNDKRIKK